MSWRERAVLRSSMWEVKSEGVFYFYVKIRTFHGLRHGKVRTFHVQTMPYFMPSAGKYTFHVWKANGRQIRAALCGFGKDHSYPPPFPE